jgi:hypothetical protein
VDSGITVVPDQAVVDRILCEIAVPDARTLSGVVLAERIVRGNDPQCRSADLSRGRDSLIAIDTDAGASDNRDPRLGGEYEVIPPFQRPLALPETVQRRLNAYALAASAAGVSVLALSGPAEAKIVYTPTHVVMNSSNDIYHPLDLNNDGVKDFSFAAYHETGMSSQFAFLRCRSLGTNSVLGGPTSARRWGDAAAFPPGIHIGAGRPYANHNTMARAGIFTDGSSIQGPWANGGKGVKDRYLGLKFAINGKTHYGWARLNVRLGRLDSEVYIKATLTGYAYETIPDKAIITGKTKGKDVITLQPASLGRLAQGPSGLQAWRGRNSVAPTR